ncbi:MAG: ATP-binding protein [Methanocella sp.]
MAIALPVEKTKPKARIEDYTGFIYGPWKIGKSTFCSRMDNPLFLATEAGLNTLEVYQIPISTWPDFLEACRLIAEGKHEYKTIVIDTVDNLYNFCSDYICKKAGIQHESDLEWGKGWDMVNDEFLRALTKLSLLPYGLWMTSHSEEKEIKSRTQPAITKVVPTLPKGARKIVLGMSDFILYAESVQTKEGMVRVLHTKPTENYEAGDRTGRLPATLPFKYASFLKAFEGGVVDEQPEE